MVGPGVGRGCSRAPHKGPSEGRKFPVRLNRRLSCVALITALALTAGVGSVRAEVLIERIFMPLDAAPSSFAIGLPSGINLCFDPVRGGVSYVWKGGFVDLSPARPGPGKFINPVKLLGPVVYQETGGAPLRRGDPARVPTVAFTGYTLHDDSVEFRYTVDGTPVREEIRTNSAGNALIRRFHVEGGSDAKWWHVTAGKPATELQRDPSGTFVLELTLGNAAP
jgi:hypothetical protein